MMTPQTWMTAQRTPCSSLSLKESSRRTERLFPPWALKNRIFLKPARARLAETSYTYRERVSELTVMVPGKFL